jgi:hypothetical protein
MQIIQLLNQSIAFYILPVVILLYAKICCPPFFIYCAILRVFLQVAAIAGVEEVLKSWNIEQTDELLKKIEGDKERKLQEEEKQQKQECDRYMYSIDMFQIKRLKIYTSSIYNHVKIFFFLIKVGKETTRSRERG